MVAFKNHAHTAPWHGECVLNGAMQTLDEMLKLKLLSTHQHAEISAWVSQARTPEAILEMPPALWRSLELASVLMEFDADLLE